MLNTVLDNRLTESVSPSLDTTASTVTSSRRPSSLQKSLFGGRGHRTILPPVFMDKRENFRSWLVSIVCCNLTVAAIITIMVLSYKPASLFMLFILVSASLAFLVFIIFRKSKRSRRGNLPRRDSEDSVASYETWTSAQSVARPSPYNLCDSLSSLLYRPCTVLASRSFVDRCTSAPETWRRCSSPDQGKAVSPVAPSKPSAHHGVGDTRFKPTDVYGAYLTLSSSPFPKTSDTLIDLSDFELSTLSSLDASSSAETRKLSQRIDCAKGRAPWGVSL